MPRGKRLDPAVLQAALEGLESRLQRVDEQMAQVRSLLRPAPRKRAVAQAPAKPQRKLSLAARKRTAAAQRKRWAEFKAKQAAQAAKRHRKSGKAVKSATA